MRKLVVGIVVYQFVMNKSSSGDIEPEFKVIVSKLSEEKKKQNINEWDLITLDDKFGVFFNHTTGSRYKSIEEQERNIFVGQLKETPYKIISKYHQEDDESQYLIITFFDLDEDIGLYENIIKNMFDHFDIRSELEKQGFNITSVSGTSIGSLIGGFFSRYFLK